MTIELNNKIYQIELDKSTFFTKDGTEVVIENFLSNDTYWAYDKSAPDKSFVIEASSFAKPGSHVKLIKGQTEAVPEESTPEVPLIGKTDFKVVQRDMEKAIQELEASQEKESAVNKEQKAKFKEKHGEKLIEKKRNNRKNRKKEHSPKIDLPKLDDSFLNFEKDKEELTLEEIEIGKKIFLLGAEALYEKLFKQQ